jgi:hypothetical protein
LEFLLLQTAIQNGGTTQLSTYYLVYYCLLYSRLSGFATLLKPKSKGRILLRSADSFDKPIIQPNYLQEEEDMDILIHGLKLFKQLVETDDLAGIAKFYDPGAISYSRDSDEYWRELVKTQTLTVYHPVRYYLL